jgi:hypothetical protein
MLAKRAAYLVHRSASWRRDCFHSRGPLSLANRPLKFLSGSSFLEATPLQSSFVLPAARRLSAQAACRSFVPLRGNLEARPLTRGFRPSLRSVLRLSQPLDGFLRAPTLQACFIPQPRPGFVPSRGFSLHTAGSSHRRVLAPLSLSAARSPVNRLPLTTASTSRLSDVVCPLRRIEIRTVELRLVAGS